MNSPIMVTFWKVSLIVGTILSLAALIAILAGAIGWVENVNVMGRQVVTISSNLDKTASQMNDMEKRLSKVEWKQDTKVTH